MQVLGWSSRTQHNGGSSSTQHNAKQPAMCDLMDPMFIHLFCSIRHIGLTHLRGKTTHYISKPQLHWYSFLGKITAADADKACCLRIQYIDSVTD